MNKKNNIDWLTIVLNDSNGGGAEQTQRNIITYLAGENNKCTVLIIQKKNHGYWEFLEKKSDIVYFPFKSPILGFLCLFPYLFYFLTRNNIKNTFSSQTLINSLLGIFKKIGFLKNSKVIVRESNSIFELFTGIKLLRYKIAYKLGYSSVDLVICQTEYMKNRLIISLPWLEMKTKVVVIENPINLEYISKKSIEIIPNLVNEKYIVAAGRLAPAKGFDILIDTFSKIHQKLDNCALYILGDGPDRMILADQIKKLGLQNKIILKGLVPNVYPYFKNAKLCVMSSRIEGFPNVLLQMMSQNEKVVTTMSAGGIDKISGIFTCPTNNELELGNAIIKCYLSNGGSNRTKFDTFLERRNLGSFVDNVLIELK